MSAASERAEHDVDPAMAKELERLLGPRGSGVRHRAVGHGAVVHGPVVHGPVVHGATHGEPEPELAQTPASSGEYAALFESLRAQVEAAEERPSFRLKTQPTMQRRLIAGLVFLALLATSAGLMPRPDLATYPLPLLVATVLSLGALFGVVLVAALRPAYLPALSPGRSRALTGLAVAATGVLAVVPAIAGEGTHPEHAGFLFHSIPCLIFGLLGAVPVYTAIRLVDRDGGHLLAFVAAGLAAGAILEVHCPFAGLAHRGLGHGAVLGVLLVGAFVKGRFRARRG